MERVVHRFCHWPTRFHQLKSKTYDLILVIVNRLTKMVYYEQVMMIINTLALAEIIVEVLVRHHSLSDSIVSNRDSVFTLKFWSSIC